MRKQRAALQRHVMKELDERTGRLGSSRLGTLVDRSL